MITQSSWQVPGQFDRALYDRASRKKSRGFDRALYDKYAEERRAGGHSSSAAAIAGSAHAAAGGTPLTIFGASILQWCNGTASTTVSTTSWTDASSAGKNYASSGVTVNATDATLNNSRTVSLTTSQTLTSSLALPQSGTTPTCIMGVIKLRALGAGNAAIFTVNGLQNNWVFFDNSGHFCSYNLGTVISVASAPVNSWARFRCDFSNSAGDITKIAALSTTGNSGNAAASGLFRGVNVFAGSEAAVDIWDILYLNAIPTSGQATAYDSWVTAQTSGAAAV